MVLRWSGALVQKVDTDGAMALEGMGEALTAAARAEPEARPVAAVQVEDLSTKDCAGLERRAEFGVSDPLPALWCPMDRAATSHGACGPPSIFRVPNSASSRWRSDATARGMWMGGVPFSRGQLRLLLGNRICLGEIQH